MIEILDQPDSLEKARALAIAVVSGKVDAALGAGLLGELCERLNYPDALIEIYQVAHLLEEDLPSFPRPALIADAMEECKRLASVLG